MKATATFAATVALAGSFALARLPATWADSAAATLSDGRLRIAAADGSLWRGNGLIATPRRDGSLQAWQAISWRVDFSQLWRGRLALDLGLGSSTQGLHAGLTPGGWRLDSVRLALPIPLLSAVLPQNLTRLGWQGRLTAHGERLECDWQRSCHGALALTWQDAGTTLLPGQAFGDYRIALRMTGDLTSIDIDTGAAAAIRVAAQGKLTGGRLRLDGTVEGPPEVVDRLPHITAPYTHAGDVPGQVVVQVGHHAGN